MTRICVATGCFYQLDLSVEQELDCIRRAGADGVEITFGKNREVLNTDIDELASLTRDFDWVSIHSPVLEEYPDNAETEDVVERLERMRKRLDAEVIVFHPNMVEHVAWVADHAAAAWENMQHQSGLDRDAFAASVPAQAPVVVDVCHAATWSRETIQYYLEAYSDRLSHVHLSAYNAETHQLLVDNREFLNNELVELLRGVPLVLENRLQQADDIVREVKFVKNQVKH